MYFPFFPFFSFSPRIFFLSLLLSRILPPSFKLPPSELLSRESDTVMLFGLWKGGGKSEGGRMSFGNVPTFSLWSSMVRDKLDGMMPQASLFLSFSLSRPVSLSALTGHLSGPRVLFFIFSFSFSLCVSLFLFPSLFLFSTPTSPFSFVFSSFPSHHVSGYKLPAIPPSFGNTENLLLKVTSCSFSLFFYPTLGFRD